MKKLLLLSIILFSISNIYSQTVLIEEEVSQEVEKPNWGKNLKHYGTFYLNFGFLAGPAEEGAAISYGRSGSFAFGYRYKYKFGNYYALGADLSMDFNNFYLKDDKDKTFPDAITHDKEYLTFSNIRLELFQRINIDRRGNTIGKYLDLGGFAGYNFTSLHYTRDKVSGDDYDRIEVRKTRLNYIEPLTYGVIARVGNNNISLFGEYRLSNIIKSSYENFLELPRIVIGMDFSF